MESKNSEENEDLKVQLFADYKGLSANQVIERLEKYGLNEIQKEKPRNILGIIFDVIKEPVTFLLIACVTLYFILGDIGEAFMLLAFIVFSVVLTIYQEKKTENAVHSLRQLSSPRALVIREGHAARIAGVQVVPGDYVVIFEGDRVPADGIILKDFNLTVDESMLTGESESVHKQQFPDKLEAIEQQDMIRPGDNKDSIHFVYSGTMVVDGNALIIIKKTGVETELGQIGKSLAEVKEEKTPLLKEINILIIGMLIIGIFASVLVFLLYGLTRGDEAKANGENVWVRALLVGLALCMSVLPEEFTVIISVYLAMGSWRISKKNVLARKSQSVENLGAVTVLCSDKTGTLTQNQMQLRALFIPPSTSQLQKQELIKLAKIQEAIGVNFCASQIDQTQDQQTTVQQVQPITSSQSKGLTVDEQIEKEDQDEMQKEQLKQRQQQTQQIQLYQTQDLFRSSYPQYVQRRRIPRRSNNALAAFNLSQEQLHHSYTLGQIYENKIKSTGTIELQSNQLQIPGYNKDTQQLKQLTRVLPSVLTMTSQIPIPVAPSFHHNVQFQNSQKQEQNQPNQSLTTVILDPTIVAQENQDLQKDQKQNENISEQQQNTDSKSHILYVETSSSNIQFIPDLNEQNQLIPEDQLTNISSLTPNDQLVNPTEMKQKQQIPLSERENNEDYVQKEETGLNEHPSIIGIELVETEQDKQYGQLLDINNLEENQAPEEQFHELIEYAVLSSQRNTFDPMDQAITTLASRSEELAEYLHEEWTMIKGYPLSKQLLSVSQVWKRRGIQDKQIDKDKQQDLLAVAAKGAPEAIINLCHLQPDEEEKIQKQMKMMATKGYRILGVARGSYKSKIQQSVYYLQNQNEDQNQTQQTQHKLKKVQLLPKHSSSKTQSEIIVSRDVAAAFENPTLRNPFSAVNIFSGKQTIPSSQSIQPITNTNQSQSNINRTQSFGKALSTTYLQPLPTVPHSQQKLTTTILHQTQTIQKPITSSITSILPSNVSFSNMRTTQIIRALPQSQSEFEFEFVGLLGFVDPIRPEVPKAIKQCTEAGIKVCMITGDHPDTAVNVAKNVGIPYKKVMLGSDIDKILKKYNNDEKKKENDNTNKNELLRKQKVDNGQLTEHKAEEEGKAKNEDNKIQTITNNKSEPKQFSSAEEELVDAIKDTQIFARVIPEHKLKLVQAFKKAGNITGMTGDGVNDAPALKAASIGIAMGGRRGTDVARDSADLVLLDDSFSSIVEACRLGRKVYNNISKAVMYVIIVHIPFAGLALLPVLFKWPLLLYPVHIVFAELLIDPACSIVFEMEPEESDLFSQPPRKSTDHVLSLLEGIYCTIQGFLILIICSLIFYFNYALNPDFEERIAGDPSSARYPIQVLLGMTFCTLMISNLGMILCNRSKTKSVFAMFKVFNPALYIIVPCAFVALLLCLYIPGLRNLFHSDVIPAKYLFESIGAGLIPALLSEVVKMGIFIIRNEGQKREHLNKEMENQLKQEDEGEYGTKKKIIKKKKRIIKQNDNQEKEMHQIVDENN